MNNRELLDSAFAAMKKSYSPYSGYTIGAALLSASGRVYTGCNIENAAFGPTNCAERTAFFKAVSEGERSFIKIAVVGGKGGSVTGLFMPCGVCRQVMAEFCLPDFQIICASSENEYEVFTLAQLLPGSFSPETISE